MIALGLVSHYLADFVFQIKTLHESRKTKIFLGNILHAIIVLLTYILAFTLYFTFSTNSPRFMGTDVFLYILLITCIHFVIDLLKSIGLKISKDNAKVDLTLFLVDQFLHFITVFIVFAFVEDKYNVHKGINSLFIISIYLIVIYIGDYTIRKIFKVLKLQSYDQKEQEIRGVGSLIGKLERIIILTMLIVSHPEVIIALIGIKSIARFPEFTEDKNNDYFILGNLLSLFFAILGYIIYLFVKYKLKI